MHLPREKPRLNRCPREYYRQNLFRSALLNLRVLTVREGNAEDRARVEALKSAWQAREQQDAARDAAASETRGLMSAARLLPLEVRLVNCTTPMGGENKRPWEERQAATGAKPSSKLARYRAIASRALVTTHRDPLLMKVKFLEVIFTGLLMGLSFLRTDMNNDVRCSMKVAFGVHFTEEMFQLLRRFQTVKRRGPKCFIISLRMVPQMSNFAPSDQDTKIGAGLLQIDFL